MTGRRRNGVAAKRVDFSYNDAGQFTSIARYASADTTNPVANSQFSYDPTGRLLAMEHRQGVSPTGALIAGYGYSYDASHRIDEVDFLPDGSNSAFDYSGEDVAYSYDARDQMTGADYETQADDAFAYDANGNRVGDQTSAGITTTYDAAGPNNQLTDDGAYEYFYDGEGNRYLRVTTATQATTRYTWDHRNRLTKVAEYADLDDALAEFSPTMVVEYAYDAFNQLVGRKLDPDGDQGAAAVEESVFVYDNGQIVLQFDRSGGAGELVNADLSHRYLWGASVDQLMADERVTWTDNNNNGADDTAADNEVLWALTDHLGTVRDVVDSTGALKNHIAYNSAGIVVSETDAAFGLMFGFTGRQFDEATGLQNNLNRWYDPAVGKWVSEDPIGFEARDANLTRYVANQFVSVADPSGLKVGNDHWFNDGWTDWINPISYVGEFGYWVGDKVGEACFVNDNPPPKKMKPIKVPPYADPTNPILAPIAPIGSQEGAGAIQAAPKIIRIGDMLKQRRECMPDVMDDDKFQEMEDSKYKNSPDFRGN